jgi:hypothetical protein
MTFRRGTQYASTAEVGVPARIVRTIALSPVAA